MNSEQKKQPKRLGPVKKAAALVATCTTLACSGPGAAVRPAPVTAEPCPRGSLEAMEQLGISIGEEGDVDYTWRQEGQMLATVSEGWTTVMLQKNLGELKGGTLHGTLLSGRIILGEKRIWGHFTQATTPEGKTYPVCLEYRDREVDPGKFFTSFDVKAVREFK